MSDTKPKAKTVKKAVAKEVLAAIATPTKATVKENLRVRAKPAATSTTLGVVPAGKVVDVLSVDGTWAKVALTSGGQPLFELGGVIPAYGYMSTAYLTFGATHPPPPPPPPPPVPTTYRRGVGIHALADGGVMEAYRAAGGNDLCGMQKYDTLSRTCDAMGKESALDGKGIVMFREYINYWPTFEQAMGYCRPTLDKRIIRIITNESEFCPGGNSVEGILRHAELDVRVARALAKLGIYGACWSGAVGNPDHTKPEIQQAFMQGYAGWWNNGLKETGIAPIMDTHTYSPNPTHIYDTWEGDVTMQVPVHSGMRAVQMAVDNAISGMDYLTEIVGRNGTPVVRLAGAGRPENTTKQPFVMESRSAAIATATMPRTFHMHETDWHETRPMLWFETSGFNLKSGGRIVVSETGVDEGGKGGFLGTGMTLQDFIRWVLRYREIYTRSVGDWFGNYCPMPLEGSVIFQGADKDHGSGHWGSYYIDPPWQAALIAAVRG